MFNVQTLCRHGRLLLDNKCLGAYAMVGPNGLTSCLAIPRGPLPHGVFVIRRELDAKLLRGITSYIDGGTYSSGVRRIAVDEAGEERLRILRAGSGQA